MMSSSLASGRSARRGRGLVVAALIVAAGSGGAARASANVPARPAAVIGAPATFHIVRIAGGIKIDGSLDEPAWQQASRVDTWFETSPGNNTEPQVESVGYLAYGDEFLYVGFEFGDPHPEDIRSPLRDRDNIDETDYGGVIIDPGNTGRTAIEMLVNAGGVQYDAVYDETNGEDATPDFFWDAAVKVHARGWTLEMRIPFSSLRYPRTDPQTWRILLHRAYQRDFRYQFFSAQLPRGRNCLVCRANMLLGLERLPAGGGLVFAPYASGGYSATPVAGPGSRLQGSEDGTAGFDAKWQPSASTAIDATINPDFSQIESDVAQITANERFALSFPEKRPFFLEGSALLATPIRAVYTRAITDPQWGARATGQVGQLSYAALVVQDEGGGNVIIPRRNSSELAPQDFRSWASIVRLRYALGASFAGVLATGREIDGGGHNRVVGPDFDWRLSEGDRLTGQGLVSLTRTPERPDLSERWNGSASSGFAGRLQWKHTTPGIDWTARYDQVTDHFRADNGFIPQAGYREGYGELGYTFRPDGGPFRQLRPFALVDRWMDLDDELLFQQLSLGLKATGLWSSSISLAYTRDRIFVGDQVLPQQQLVSTIKMSPSTTFLNVELTGSAGQQIDFDNGRTGIGADVALGLTLQPSRHIELVLNENLRLLAVRSGGERQRLFTARVDRVRATYSVSPRLFVRLIGQYEVTRRDPALYTAMVARKDAAFSGAALLAFRLNWQSVVFVGYGDNRVSSDETLRLEPDSRQLFVKFSYAFQY